jgi:hypothetical protein
MPSSALEDALAHYAPAVALGLLSGEVLIGHALHFSTIVLKRHALSCISFSPRLKSSASALTRLSFGEV